MSTTSFLPFVSSESSPEVIFKALWKRSKGISLPKKAALFSAILERGIDSVREVMHGYEGNYETAYAHFSQYSPDMDSVTYWFFLINIFGLENIKNNEKMDAENFSYIFAVLSKYDNHKNKINELGFHVPHEHVVKYSVFDEIKIEENSKVKYSDKGDKVGFIDKQDLQAFTCLSEFYLDKNVYVHPILVNLKFSENDAIPDSYYEAHNCISPKEFLSL